MKILSNKKYNDLISKQFRGIFADINDDNLLRENGLLYGENKELKQEIERLNNIINELENYIRARADDNNTCSVCSVMTDDLLNILKGSDEE